MCCRYCSKVCQEAAWSDYHQVLCPAVNQAAGKLYDLRDNDGWGHNAQGEWREVWGGHYSPLVLARIWAAVLCQVRVLQERDGNVGGEPTVAQWATAKAPYRRCVSCNMEFWTYSYQ